MIDYDGRRFRSVRNSAGGDVSGDTVFEYRQAGAVVWATYSGGGVLLGTLLARVADDGSLDMRYQHLAPDGQFRAGRCESRPERLPDGRLRLHERWRWTDGADGTGTSVVEEVAAG
ncbi:MAG: hypothetical protein R2712_02645 [Vicinamibacterales bacterium]